MQTLPYGLKRPQAGVDYGDAFFPAMESNLTQLDAHTHDGVTSPKISSANIVAVSQSILAAAWVSVAGGNGMYKQTVTIPGPFLFDQVTLQIRLSTGEIIWPTIQKVSSTTYDIFVNDNTLNLTAVYSS